MRKAIICLSIFGLIVSLFFLWSSVPLRADKKAPSQRAVDFHRDIKPIFKAHCLACHGEKKPRGGVQLLTRKSVLELTDSGKPAIVPGHSGKSLLIQRVLASDERDRMPPRGTPLTARQIQLLKTWIDQGAPWPEKAARHWAYIKPVRPPLPKVKNTQWPKNGIDYFILAKLEQKGLQPSAEADRATLIRRVYLDLIGLPPTIAQVDAFLKDSRSDAYERVVDELLASPHYGERWAQHWLDLARYADSNGFQRDGFRTVWPYRDWVINAFNKDMPFDRFTIEQIAGDLLPSASLQQKIATGFNRCTTVNVEAGVDREEDRVNAVIDRVNTTATVWLGTTLACAQCHEHKYDPFDQKDYYRFFAYFNSTKMETAKGGGANREFIGPKVTIPLDPEKEELRKTLEQKRTALNRSLKKLVKGVAGHQREWEKTVRSVKQKLKTLPKNVRRIVVIARKKRNKKQQKLLRTYFTNLDPEIKDRRAELKELNEKLKRLQPVTSLVMEEAAKPRQTHVFQRGNFLDKLEQVKPGVPQSLHPLPTNAPANRLGLARWLVDGHNPLTARVAVNRWWAQFFGHGIVATLEDFGTQCEPPTHPQLLDWLATEFMRQGWSMKKLHRLIVTSATYRQASDVNTELLAKDPKNRLYARGPRVRMPAEMIRDNILSNSGLLSRKIGGPPVYPPQPAGLWNVTGRVDNTYRTSKAQDRYRRGLYTIWRRSSPYPSFIAFDAPDRSSCVVKRPRTNTPLQALTLMNDPVYVEAALALGRRMMSDHAAMNTKERLVYGFRLALIRQPGEKEVNVLQRIYDQARQRYRQNPADARKLVRGFPQSEGVDAVELAAWFRVATVLINLDETITKH